MAALLKLRLHPARRELRVFGAACALLPAALAVWRATHGDRGFETGALTGVALVAAALAALAPSLLRPIYIALSVVTYPLGFVLSYVLLAVVYFAVLTPMGLVMRAFGRDRLHRGRDPAARSYFTPRKTTGDTRRYFRQY